MDLLKVKQAIESTETRAVVLNTILNKLYDEEWVDWDPTTLYLELRDDLKAEPSAEAMDRIAALQVIQTSGEFFSRFEAFSGITNTLNSGEPSFTLFNPVSAPEIAWALVEVSLIRDLLPFDYSVRKYIQTVLEGDGIDTTYPAIFEHLFDTSDPSSNVVKELTAEMLSNPNRDAIEEYINDQLRDTVYQYNKLGLQDELERMLNAQDLEDVLNE